MKIKCVWEHNSNDSLLYSTNYIGAFTRGETKEVALSKMQGEVKAYLRWKEESGQIFGKKMLNFLDYQLLITIK